MSVIQEFKGFPPVLEENTTSYFAMLEGVISSIDELAEMAVNKTPTEIKFRLVPSSNEYFEYLIKELNALHNLMNIKVKFSKSMKGNMTIYFSIELL